MDLIFWPSFVKLLCEKISVVLDNLKRIEWRNSDYPMNYIMLNKKGQSHHETTNQ